MRRDNEATPHNKRVTKKVVETTVALTNKGAFDGHASGAMRPVLVLGLVSVLVSLTSSLG